MVEYDYDALHDDELTLRPGDIIKNVRYVEEDGWMEGDLNGKRGLFPDNFVKVRDRLVFIYQLAYIKLQLVCWSRANRVVYHTVSDNPIETGSIIRV